jgi:hypothetical protein
LFVGRLHAPSALTELAKTLKSPLPAELTIEAHILRKGATREVRTEVGCHCAQVGSRWPLRSEEFRICQSQVFAAQQMKRFYAHWHTTS